MKKQLRKDLMDKRITDLVGKNNIFLLHAATQPKTDYIEYEVYDKKYADYSGGEHKSEIHLIQVDIFSKGDYSSIEDAVEEVLHEKGYKFIQSADLYEQDTKLYHKAMRFNYKKFLK